MKLKKVNLIPKEILIKPFFRQLVILYKKNIGVRRFVIAAVYIFAITLVQIILFNIYSSTFNESKRRMQEAKAKLNQMQSKYILLEKVKLDLTKQDLRERDGLEELLSTSSEGKRYAQLLVDIAGLLPSKDLWITRFILNESEIHIAGATLNNELIPQFMAKLDESKMFKNSKFSSSEKQVIESHTLYNFQIVTEPVWSNIGGNK